MKAHFLIPAVLLLAACADEAETPDDGLSDVERELDGLYDQERVERRNALLASSEACFADDRAALLEENQTLMERGALAIDIIAHAVDGQREVFEFPVVELSQDQRDRLNAAAADFYRAAGEVHDYDTDDTIYHRDQSGTNCTVVKDPAIGRPLIETARAIVQERAG